MTYERRQKRSGLVKILGTVFLSAVTLLTSIPLVKSAYNRTTHNYSESFSDKIETHEIAFWIDSWMKYSKFGDGTEQIEFHRGSLDSLTSCSFDSAHLRTYDGGDKIQEMKVGNIIVTRDKNYRQFLGSFNYADVLLGEFRKIAEHRKSEGEVYQGSRT